jgi:hypothetical protein
MESTVMWSTMGRVMTRDGDEDVPQRKWQDENDQFATSDSHQTGYPYRARKQMRFGKQISLFIDDLCCRQSSARSMTRLQLTCYTTPQSDS